MSAGTGCGRLDGRRVVLTGAAANIGAATARLFGREGAAIVIADIDPCAQETVDRLTADDGVDATFIRTDVSSAVEVQRLFDLAAQLMGGVDIIVNNAGVQRSALVTDMTEEQWDLHMSVNAKSCFLSAKFGVPYLRSTGVSPAIVNMASRGGFRAPAGLSGYGASKGAIIAFTRSLAFELAGDGIRVNAVAPGWIDTSFNDPVVEHMGGREVHALSVKATVPLGRQGRPEEVAEAFLYLASEESSFTTGQILILDGGVSS